jgi:hypothetical protein
MMYDKSERVTPVRKLIREAVPTKYGLYPHELLALEYATKYYTDELSGYPGFWWEGYGVRDMPALYSSLYRRGFIAVGGVLEALRKATAADIGAALKTCGLKQAGKKEEKIQRLVDEADTAKITTLFPRTTWKLTDKGADALEGCEWVLYLHRKQDNYLPDIFEASKIMASSQPHTPYKSVLLQYLFDEANRFYSGSKFRSYYICLLSAAKMQTEDSNYSQALDTLAYSVAWCLSAKGDTETDSMWAYRVSELCFPYEDSSFIKLGYHTLSLIEECRDGLDISDSQVYERMLDKLETMDCRAFTLFIPQECADIVLYELSEDTDALEWLYSAAYTRIKAHHFVDPAIHSPPTVPQPYPSYAQAQLVPAQQVHPPSAPIQQVYAQPVPVQRIGIICPLCHSTNVTVQITPEVKQRGRGLFMTLLWILLAVCTLGIALLFIPLLRRGKTKTTMHKYCLCQSCGNSWEIAM